MDGRADPFASLAQARAWYGRWLTEEALPLWATSGFDAAAARFHETLAEAGPDLAAPRRARVQARQIWVYATAARLGLGAPQLDMARAAYEGFVRDYRQVNGLFVMSLGADGGAYDASQPLYEQAFALLAMAGLRAADPKDARPLEDSRALRQGIEAFRHAAGGFREVGGHPFQANAQMHLLEAALAWEDLGEPGWEALADEIVALALSKFIDAEGGFLREFFEVDWRPAAGDDGRWVEPGHQFEWAWLLTSWAGRRKDARAAAAAQALYANGLKGVDRTRGVAANILWDDFSVRDGAARLWPQTEYLKASLVMGREEEARLAAQALFTYLGTPAPGAWRDLMGPDGRFVDGPAPASSFYHIAGACFALLAA